MRTKVLESIHVRISKKNKNKVCVWEILCSNLPEGMGTLLSLRKKVV